MNEKIAESGRFTLCKDDKLQIEANGELRFVPRSQVYPSKFIDREILKTTPEVAEDDQSMKKRDKFESESESSFNSQTNDNVYQNSPNFEIIESSSDDFHKDTLTPLQQ